MPDDNFVSFKLNAALNNRLNAAADTLGVSRSSLLRIFIKGGLEAVDDGHFIPRVGGPRVTTHEFEEHVRKHAKGYTDVNYCVVALNEEAGEVAGHYKKMVLRGNPGGKRTEEGLLSELGDVLYYLTRLASHYGWTLEQVMAYNQEKLERRVKEGK